MKKKFLAFSLALVMLLAMVAGCGGDANNNDANTTPETEEPAENATGAENNTEGAASALKIAVVTSPSGVDDGSFNQDNYIGVQSFIAANPDASVSAIREVDIAKSVPTAESVAADYDVILTPGYQFAGISQVALDNPDKKFILVDSFPTEIDGVAEFENIYAMTFAEQESGFFAGIAAAMETQTGKVAVVNGIAYPSNVNYQKGFESGVNYANAHYGTSAEIVSLTSYAGQDVTGANIGGNYVGTFDDEATGKVVGSALLDAGVDIIFVAAGASGNGVFTAVKERGNAYVIGCDVDQFDDGVNGSENIILTSGLKVMSLNVERALTAIADGSFVGANVVLGAESDSTGLVIEDGRHQLSDETITAYLEAFELVKSGAVVPAADITVNEYASDNFPGLA